MPKCSLKLKCEYTDVELSEKRDELSTVILEAMETEKRKAETAKEFKEDIETLHVRRDTLAMQIKARGEHREVECVVELNKPTVGIKRIVRLDTGEFVKDEPMTDAERQANLFVESEEIRKMYEKTDPRATTEQPPEQPTA